MHDQSIGRPLLRLMLCPRIVTAGRFTSIDEALRAELEACGVPWPQTLDLLLLGYRGFRAGARCHTSWCHPKSQAHTELCSGMSSHIQVRTKIDLDVWNNKEDNQIDEVSVLLSRRLCRRVVCSAEESTIESIRQELYRLHGANPSRPVLAQAEARGHQCMLVRWITCTWYHPEIQTVTCWLSGESMEFTASLLRSLPPSKATTCRPSWQMHFLA